MPVVQWWGAWYPGSGVWGHGADLTATPWYGSGPPLCTVSPLFPHCGPILASFGLILASFGPFLVYLASFWPHFGPFLVYLASFWPCFCWFCTFFDHPEKCTFPKIRKVHFSVTKKCTFPWPKSALFPEIVSKTLSKPRGWWLSGQTRKISENQWKSLFLVKNVNFRKSLWV